jgi:hypothetical protein
MTIPVSVRVDAIAERFHIDCHMFCILLGQDPKAVSDSALECFGRGKNLLWPTGAPSLIDSIDAVGDLLGLAPRCVRVIQDLAGKEAQALHHSYVGTEHILLGLARR